MTAAKVATTFGGSGFSRGHPVYEESVQLGRSLAERGYVVRCGGYFGLMEGVAAGVSEVGGTCVGVTLATFGPKPANDYISMEERADDMFDRMRALIGRSSLFVVQQGALGTVAELFLVWCMKYTATLSGIRICLVGECWNGVFEGLRGLSIEREEFGHVEVFGTMEDFLSTGEAGKKEGTS